MGVPFDYAPDRPEHIDAILNGLDRYNPETTNIFQEYVTLQCEEKTYDCYANLALLKLLALHLLPPHILTPISASSSLPAAGDAPLSEAVQKLAVLNTLLSSANYSQFWSTLDSDDLYADLIADVSGFEELVRIRIASTISQSVREVASSELENWLGMNGEAFEKFIKEVCGWTIENGVVIVPLNKENEAKGTVVRENVKMEQFSRVIKRAYEQPA
ncbi:eukaryotic translation initiation factor 3 subunit [Botrytis cinerea]